jgi:hypothetical protein
MERRSSSTATDMRSKEQDRQNKESNAKSILDSKAVSGRIEQHAELSSARAIGRNIWLSQFNQMQSRYQAEKRWDPYVRPISLLSYEQFQQKQFEKNEPSVIAASVDKESNERGSVIFTGNWNGGGSLVKISHPFSGKSYSFIPASDVASASLYLPYLVSFERSSKGGGRLTKATAPLVAVDEEMFAYDKNEVTYHREFRFDPRIDLRSYDTTNIEAFQLRRIENRQLEFVPGLAEPATIAKLLGCCVYVRPPAYKGQLVKFLKEIRFDVRRLSVALMVHDSASRSYLASDRFFAQHGRAEVIHRNTKDIEPWVVAQLKKASGGTLLLLSHVEGKDYVVREANGAEVGRISIERTNELALLHGVTLFNLGCKTGAVLRQHDGIGVYDTFNSIHMLKTISKALSTGPKTIASFLERLGTPEARIVIPASIMANADALAALHRLHDESGREIVEKGRIRVPAIDPIVSPRGMTQGFPTAMSVFLTSRLPNERGFFPVVAEINIVMSGCAVLAAAKKLTWDGSERLTCKEFKAVPYKPVVTHLYGDLKWEVR